MTDSRLLFFDDYPLHSENKLFLERLRGEMDERDVRVQVEKTFRAVEVALRSHQFRILVLDIMSAVPGNLRDSAGARIRDSKAGIELLSRCRAGRYLEENKAVPIFMRTTRAEGFIRRECLEASATGFFLAGKEDGRLIRRIMEELGK